MCLPASQLFYSQNLYTCCSVYPIVFNNPLNSPAGHGEQLLHYATFQVCRVLSVVMHDQEQVANTALLRFVRPIE